MATKDSKSAMSSKSTMTPTGEESVTPVSQLSSLGELSASMVTKSTSETPTETYHQIIPGMSDHLYPILLADGLLSMQVADNQDTLQNQITSEVDKYLQEAAERCERDINYFDGRLMATNTPSQQQKADSVEHDEEMIPELIDQNTGENGEINTEHYV